MQYEYIDSTIDSTDKFPMHWKKDKIFRLSVMLTSGGTPSSKNETFYDGDIYWVQSGDLNDGLITDTEKKITQEALENSSAKLFPKGTLLVAMYGATIGKLGILQMESATNQACCGIVPTEKISTIFLFYFFQYIKDNLISNAYGGGQSNISQSIIKQTYLYYPPDKLEQNAITQYLENACTNIDKVIAIKKKQISNVQNQLRSTIYNATTKGLNPNIELQDSGEILVNKIPVHWKFDRLKDLVELRTDKTDEKSEDIDYIELEDIEKETGRVLNFRNTLEVAGKVTLFYEGDVLFCKLRPYLVKHHLAVNNGKCTGEILVYNCTKIINRYFQYCISSHGFIQKCTAISYGAKMPRVDPTKQLAYFVLPLPPRKEQVEICDFLDEIKTKTYDLTKKIEIQIETLQQFKKSLIQEVITGKKQVYGLT